MRPLDHRGARWVGDVDNVEPGRVGDKQIAELQRRRPGAGDRDHRHQLWMERVVHVELDDPGIGADIKAASRQWSDSARR